MVPDLFQNNVKRARSWKIAHMIQKNKLTDGICCAIITGVIQNHLYHDNKLF